jgi:hypothetical protein
VRCEIIRKKFKTTGLLISKDSAGVDGTQCQMGLTKLIFRRWICPQKKKEHFVNGCVAITTS